MLTDTYAYNTLDQLTSYTGYDGYTQQFAYDANGMRLSMSEAGDANRSTLEELLRENRADRMRLLSAVDVLVDGPFIAERKNLSLRFRGSDNQRLIDLPKTLKTGAVVLWDETQ